ncbi:hypothetical protein [Mongoliitalea lutea]|uniref:Uncharacterized protein n=1 Tax=Mongoliitalea lutea TaxID=849756 RepID=A0A8J3CTZ0_9BACT|nr:hypothetical protein [Mongoliitalea lutea]GHB25669.1 hypothetical protein GCM10008106_03060 [Mongoliitalea lutea]
MKKITLIHLFCAIMSWTGVNAQSSSGNLLINNSSRTKIENPISIVHHFGDFKTGKNKIVFNLETKGFPTTSDGKEVAIIVFETIVKSNGRVISQSKGKPLPFFPGEMGMPIEAFDIISPIFLHQYGIDKSIRDNPKLNPVVDKGATYEVEVRAEVLNGNGKVDPAFLIIII